MPQQRRPAMKMFFHQLKPVRSQSHKQTQRRKCKYSITSLQIYFNGSNCHYPGLSNQERFRTSYYARGRLTFVLISWKFGIMQHFRNQDKYQSGFIVQKIGLSSPIFKSNVMFDIYYDYESQSSSQILRQMPGSVRPKI